MAGSGPAALRPHGPDDGPDRGAAHRGRRPDGTGQPWRHADDGFDTPSYPADTPERPLLALSAIAEPPTVPASGRSSSPQPGVLCRMPPSRTCEPGTHRTMG